LDGVLVAVGSLWPLSWWGLSRFCSKISSKISKAHEWFNILLLLLEKVALSKVLHDLYISKHFDIKTKKKSTLETRVVTIILIKVFEMISGATTRVKWHFTYMIFLLSYFEYHQLWLIEVEVLKIILIMNL
jgi:hypothetical protein